MRKYFGALAALLLLVAPVYAQSVQRVPLAVAWDMDGEAADDDQVVASATYADSTTFTIAAQPDTCRVVNLTLTDADSSITAGVLTVTGTDCWGDALVCTYTANAGGTGVKALTYSSGNATTCAFASITSVVSGALTGEGGAGDTLKVGYTANSDYTYPIYGYRTSFHGLRYVDPFRKYDGVDAVTVSSTTLASYTTADGGAFQNVSVGDLIYLTWNGRTFERRVTVVTDDDTATIDLAIPTAVAPTATDKVKMQFKKFFKLVEATDAWIPVAGKEAAFFNVDVDLNANTGGVTSNIECSIFSDGEFLGVTQIDTDNVASAATGTNTTSLDTKLAPFSHCRAGFKFGTGDDADTANEDINVYALLTRRN